MYTRRCLLFASQLLSVVLLVPISTHLNAQQIALSDSGTTDIISSILGASRLSIPMDSGRVPAQTRVITAEEIKVSGAKTVQDLLRSQPGIVLYNLVGNDYQQTLDLRGFNASPVPVTVVFVDGVRINEADFGQVNFHLIAMSNIERIEVIPGPQTLYGKDAMGGVINIITKQSTAKTEGQVESDFGSFGLQRYLASVSGPMGAGPLAYRLAASRETENGYRYNSGVRIHLFDGRLDYKDDATKASLTYQYGDDALKQAGALTASEISVNPRQNISFVDMDSLLHCVTLNAQRQLTDASSVSLNGHVRQRLENTPLNQGRTSVSKSRSDMGGRGMTLQFNDNRELLGRRNTLTGGVELTRNAVVSSSFGEYGGYPFASGNSDIERQIGLFAQETFDLVPNLLVLTAGARHDRDELQHQDMIASSNNGSRIFYHTSPRVGLNFNPMQGLEAFTVFSESFRAPTSDEISSLGPFSSSPMLKPVRARSGELGVRTHFGAWGEASVSIYRTMVNDEIFPVYDPTAGYGQNINIDKTRRDGLEVSIKPRWSDVLDGYVNYGYTEATFQTNFVLDKAPYPSTQQVSKGDYMPQVPRHRLGIGMNFHLRTDVTIGLDELCVSSQRVFGDESNTEPRLGGYCVMGGGAAYERNSIRIFMRADNLLSREYVVRGILGTNPTSGNLERYLMPSSGLSISGGISYRFAGRQ